MDEIRHEFALLKQHNALAARHDPGVAKSPLSVGEKLKAAEALAARKVRYDDRLGFCSHCKLCEKTSCGAQLWSRCRALGRRLLLDFIEAPMAACPAGLWHADYDVLDYAPVTREAVILIGSDAKAAHLVAPFVRFLRRHSSSAWPILLADFGLAGTRNLPVDAIFTPPGRGLHPMYRKPLAALYSGASVGVWYDTDILVRVDPALAIAEMGQEKGLGVRRGELWWQVEHRADNWHTGMFAWRWGDVTLRHWASLALHGDGAFVTAPDEHHIRDEELLAELLRTRPGLPIHALSPRHARLPSEFHADLFGMPAIPGVESENWHFPGTPGKQEFLRLAKEDEAR